LQKLSSIFWVSTQKLTVATFACKHRYTKKWICSVPCDGHDDLCEGFADEDCDPASKYLITLAVAFFLIIITIIGDLFIKNIKIFDKPSITSNELDIFRIFDGQDLNLLENVLNASNKDVTKLKQSKIFKKVNCIFYSNRFNRQELTYLEN